MFLVKIFNIYFHINILCNKCNINVIHFNDISIGNIPSVLNARC